MIFENKLADVISKNARSLDELNAAIATCELLALPDKGRFVLAKTAENQLRFGRLLVLIQTEGGLQDAAGRAITEEVVAAADEASDNVFEALKKFRADLVKE